jgi:hypothetical protein
MVTDSAIWNGCLVIAMSRKPEVPVLEEKPVLAMEQVDQPESHFAGEPYDLVVGVVGHR